MARHEDLLQDPDYREMLNERGNFVIDASRRHRVFSPTCTGCRHLHDSADRKCAAFESAIPDEIWLGRNAHRDPYPGDQGIQFEPRRGAT